MKKTSLQTISACLALLFITVLPAAAQTASVQEVEQLRAALRQMQSGVEQLNARIAELEKENTAAHTAAVIAAARGQTPPQAATAAANTANAPVDLSEISDGYIAIPSTGLKVRFNVKPKLDVTVDNRNSGNPDRFVTAQIPTEKGDFGDYSSTSQFNMNMKGSSLRFDATSIDPAGKFLLHYDNDFYGRGDNELNFRINQLYVQYGNLIMGKSVMPFEDSDMWFDGLDYEGPTSMIYARAVQVRYNWIFDGGWSAAASFSKPGAWIQQNEYNADGEHDDVGTRNRLPDFSANVRWDDARFGHVQGSVLARELTTTAGDPKGGQDVFAWGVNLSAGINLSPRDTVQLQGTYGQGTFAYINDFFRAGEAAYNGSGDLKALTYTGFLAGYSHRWSDKFRSTIGYSTAIIDNENAQPGDAYHKTQYGMANIIWTAAPRLDIGFEMLYGWNKVKSGDKGDVIRAQVSMGYSLF